MSAALARVMRVSGAEHGAQLVAIVVCWLAALAVVLAMVGEVTPAWDAKIYLDNVRVVRAGGDPYAAGLAAQKAFHEHHAPGERRPFSYVYSPMTLPDLRAAALLPDAALAWLYLSLVALGFLAILAAGFCMALPTERVWLAMMLPFSGFFPGLLWFTSLLSGNVAFILYGAILLAALRGVRTRRWSAFYAAVLVASVFKAPMLGMLALAVWLGEAQWMAAAGTGLAGAALWLAQRWLWPRQFAEYLAAVQMQFDWNQDFGLSPAGAVGKWAWQAGRAYASASLLFHACFAAVVLVAVLWLARRMKRGALPAEHLLPVAALAAVLLNPRVKEYDVAAITVPMLLIAWRTLRALVQAGEAESPAQGVWRWLPSPALAAAAWGCFALVNLVAGDVNWDLAETASLTVTLAAGAGLAWWQSRAGTAFSALPPAEARRGSLTI